MSLHDSLRQMSLRDTYLLWSSWAACLLGLHISVGYHMSPWLTCLLGSPWATGLLGLHVSLGLFGLRVSLGLHRLHVSTIVSLGLLGIHVSLGYMFPWVSLGYMSPWAICLLGVHVSTIVSLGYISPWDTSLRRATCLHMSLHVSLGHIFPWVTRLFGLQVSLGYMTRQLRLPSFLENVATCLHGSLP